MVAFDDVVRQRFGVLPNFFCLTPDNPAISENLWEFARASYLDNPLPSLFKERLFVWLARFCEVRYCVARHAGFLAGLGHPAGDAAARPQPLDEVLQLLGRPVPGDAEIAEHNRRCARFPAPAEELPAPGCELEFAMFACATQVFLQTPGRVNSHAALQHLLGPERMQYLLALLAYARVAHYWTEVHAELALEDDITELLASNDLLRQRLLHDPAAGSKCLASASSITEAQLQRELADDRLLHEISIELIGTQEVATLYGKIVEAAARLMRSSYACMHMLRRSADGKAEFELLGHRGFPHEAVVLWKRLEMDRANGWSSVLACNRHTFVQDVETAPFLSCTDDLEMYRRMDVRSLHATPLCTRSGALVGAIITYWHEQHVPDPREEQLLDILARQAADLIERGEAEEAQRASQARFLRALQPQNVGVIFFEIGGRITEANDAFLRLSGYTREDIAAGRVRWDTMTPPEWMADSMHAIEQFKALGYTVPYEKQYQRKDGSRWWGLFAATGLSENEGVEYVIDISARKRAEEALREADRRKDEFLATLAHELRNPLAPISNAVQLMRHPGGRRSADRLVDMVDRQVHQIVRLVDDLLDVSRITRGKIELNRAPVPLAGIVHDAVETSRPLIEQGRHRLELRMPNEPVMVDADSVRLTQALANLLNNAAKYTDHGGCIELSVEVHGASVAISVRDNGIGIEPEHLPRVFDLFMQAHRPNARSSGGLGIGLTMVRNLVEMHGGTVEAKSGGPGKGSEFIVRLPVAANIAAGACPPVAAFPPAPLTGKRILVVDDNRDAADSLGLLLELDGAQVKVAYDGPSALAAVEEGPPDAVLLDLGMPGMDGYEVARRLRGNDRLRGLQVIALTGWGQEADRARTRAYGFDHHLTKPVDVAALVGWLSGAGDGVRP